MTIEEKIKRVIELQRLTKEYTEEMKQLKVELYPHLEDKQTYDGYSISKSATCTYKLKEGVNVLDIASKYPDYIKLDTSKLYAVMENVDKYIDKTTSMGLTFKQAKKKEENKNLDF